MKTRLAESGPVETGPRVESRRPLSSRPGDEINLAEYVATCWRYRYVILPAVLLTAIVTYVVNRQITPTYEATVRLLATESKVGDDPLSRAISVARFRELLESPSLIAAILQEFKLTAPPHGLTPQAFLARHVSVSEIPDTGILQADIRLTDPDVLVKLSNRYAASAVDLAERLNRDESVYAREVIQGQVGEARKSLTKAQNELEGFRKKTQIELMQKDVESLLEHRPDVMSLQMDIETERAQLRQAEIELSQQERVRDVRRSLDALPDAPVTPPAPKPAEPTAKRETSPIWNQPLTPGATAPDRRAPGAPQSSPGTTTAQRGTTGQRGTTTQRGASPDPSDSPDVRREPSPRIPPSSPLPLRSELNDPYVNPVYEVLARDVAQSRTRLAGLVSRRQQLVSELKLSAPSNAKLQALYAAETQLAHHIGEYEVARTAYMNASSKYEEARLQITVRSPRLQILDLALPPERPVSPNIPRNVAAAAMVALTMSVVAVLLFDSSRRRT